MTASEKKKREKEILRKIEDFIESKVEPKVKGGLREVEKLLKKEIKLGKIKELDIFKYDPDSPFSYISAFLRDEAVASVAPSTKYVVKRVLKAMDLKRAKVVVEFGPAEGVITKRILEEMRPGTHLVAIETNAHFVETLRKIHDPRLHVVEGDVQNVDSILEELGFAEADAITSGIPFSFFRPRQRHQLLEKVSALLSENGRFVPYQFTTHLIPLLKDYFREVDTEFEIRNLPPFFVFTCLK